MDEVALLRGMRSSNGPAKGSYVILDRHILSFDGLRAIAVILTQLSHIVKRDHMHFKHASARAGVAIFFVLSGFLITGVLISLQAKYQPANRSSRRPSYRHLLRFYMDRTVRLLPALTLMLITTLSLKFYFYGIPDPAALHVLAKDAFYCLTYTTNVARIANLRPEGGMWENVWSLAVEEQFYIFWSLALPVLMMTGKRSQLIIMSAMIAASLFVKYSEFRNVLQLNVWIRHWTSPLGNVWKMLLGASLRLFPAPAWLQKPAWSYAALLVIVALQTHAWFVSKWTWNGIPATFFYETTSTFAVVPLMVSVVANENALLCTNSLTFVGRISYSFYLYQVPLLTIAGGKHGGWPRGYPGFAITALAFICAVASTLYVEEPIRRLYRQRMQKSAPVRHRSEILI